MNKALIFALIFAAGASTDAPARNLSPATKMKLERAAAARQGAPALDAPTTMVRAFLTYNSEEALDSVRYYGGLVREGVVDGMATVSLPLAEIERFGNMPQVDYIEVGPEVKLLNNNVRELAKVDAVHEGTGFERPFTGKGVVVGVIDSGVQYGHKAFRDADGNLRIKRVWNQTGMGKSPEGFGYGAEYTTPDQILGASFDTAATYHGTHVTGTAAGGDMATKYYGMAPDADIVFVSFSNDNATGISDAIEYIFDYADEVDKPCVINMSLGSHQGPHDGTSALDRMIDALAGPGRIIVGAVGNEGNVNIHASKSFTEGDTVLKTMLGYSSNAAMARTGIEIWGDAGQVLKLKVGVANPLKGTIVAQSKEFLSTDDNGFALFDYDETGADVTFMVYPSVSADNRPNIYIEATVEEMASNKKPCIIVEGEAGTTVHMWNVGAESFTSAGRNGWTDGEQACSAGEIGGTANRIISVGAFNSCNTVYPYFDPDYAYTMNGINLKEISYFSSHGPTVDGRIKPDVLAGGMLLVSAMSEYSAEFSPSECVDRVYDDKGKAFYYTYDAGTSMSSPAVAGIVALWLEANPKLTPEEIRQVLQKSCIRDSYCGHVPNNDAGYGKIDASAGLKQVINRLTGLDEADLTGMEARAWAAAGVLTVVTPVAGHVSVTSVGGAAAMTVDVAAGCSDIDVSGLVRGIYVVTLPDGTASKLII